MLERAFDYRDLDAALQPWATSHGLHVYTRAQDTEVRTIAVVDDSGDTYHIHATPHADTVTVDATLFQRGSGDTFSRERSRFVFHQTTTSQLASALDSAFDRITTWIVEGEHTLRHDTTI